MFFISPFGPKLVVLVATWLQCVRADTWMRSDQWGTRESNPWTDNPYRYPVALMAIICHANKLPEYLEFAYDWPDPKIGPVGIPHGSQAKFRINWRADIDHRRGERLVAVEAWKCSNGKDFGRLCFVSFVIARMTDTEARWEDARTYECGNPTGAKVEAMSDEAELLAALNSSRKRSSQGNNNIVPDHNKADPVSDDDDKSVHLPHIHIHHHHKPKEEPEPKPKPKQEPDPPGGHAKGIPVHGPVMGHPVNTAWGYPVYHHPVVSMSPGGRLPPNAPRYGSLSTDHNCRCGYGMSPAEAGFVIVFGGGYLLYKGMYEFENRRQFDGMEPVPVWHQYNLAKPTPYIFFEGESVDIDYHGKVRLGVPRIDQLALWYLHLN